MKKIFCSSKNLRNFTQVLNKKMNIHNVVEEMPVQQHFEHWVHRSASELRKEYLNLIFDIKKKALAEGFVVCFVFEDYIDYSLFEQNEISEGCTRFIFSNDIYANFNELILNIGRKVQAIGCINSYINCLNGYIDDDKTLPASDTLILNYTEIYKSKLKRNFDIKQIEFDNEELWDLESVILDDYKTFIA
jgi:hypothetical protein